jgi:demethylsterigmatocystin 6-O-methyltransferase
MTAVHDGQKTWLDAVEFKELVEGGTAETPIFVDVGGGIGSQCALLKTKLPDLPGRVILQDMPQAIDFALPTPGVENTAVDFWGEQPIKGMTFPFKRKLQTNTEKETKTNRSEGVLSSEYFA